MFGSATNFRDPPRHPTGPLIFEEKKKKLPIIAIVDGKLLNIVVISLADPPFFVGDLWYVWLRRIWRPLHWEKINYKRGQCIGILGRSQRLLRFGIYWPPPDLIGSCHYLLNRLGEVSYNWRRSILEQPLYLGEFNS